MVEMTAWTAGVGLGVAVLVRVGVFDGVSVEVLVGVLVGVLVTVGVLVIVGVFVLVPVAVGVGVFDSSTLPGIWIPLVADFLGGAAAAIVFQTFDMGGDRQAA